MSELYLRKSFITVSGVRFDGRINFEVYRGNSVEAVNKSKVSIYNLSAAARSAIDKREGDIVINAGYGENVPILFIGGFGLSTQEHPTPVFHERKGADIITTIEMAGKGEENLQAYSSVSLAPGATISQVFEIIKSQLGVPLGAMPAAMNQFQFLNGFAHEGSLKKLIMEVSDMAKLNISLQDGKLQAIEKDKSTGEVAVLLNVGTGLIGIPNKTVVGFKVKSLLNPLLTPGRQVRVESKMLTAPAVFVIDRVKHVGDTFDNDWYSEIENGSIGGLV